MPASPTPSASSASVEFAPPQLLNDGDSLLNSPMSGQQSFAQFAGEPTNFHTKLTADFFFDRDFLLNLNLRPLHRFFVSLLDVYAHLLAKSNRLFDCRQELAGHLTLLHQTDVLLRSAALLDGTSIDFAFGPARNRSSRASAAATAAQIFCRKYEHEEGAKLAALVGFYTELYTATLDYHKRIESSYLKYMVCCSSCGLQTEASVTFRFVIRKILLFFLFYLNFKPLFACLLDYTAIACKERLYRCDKVSIPLQSIVNYAEFWVQLIVFSISRYLFPSTLFAYFFYPSLIYYYVLIERG
jgi:hypothetical protein